mmetsp:Transcript_5776/g.9162  ORF Transcript_5776/g.9162 Transcript_5776/m.9162 type:complete len:315 (+) Transcript_5776:679-1623(+)
MNRPYYKSNAKNDPCGAKLEQFYHTAYNDMEVLEQNKKDALAMYKELSKFYGEDELKPDEFMTAIHQFAQAFKAANTENTNKREEEERIRKRREDFLKQMQDKEKKAEARRAAKLKGDGKTDPAPKPATPRVPSSGNTKDQEKDSKPTPSSSKTTPAPLRPQSTNEPARRDSGGTDSIGDLINGMPKSGKFVIKKQPGSAEGNKLLRDHLQKRTSESSQSGGDNTRDFDEVPRATSATGKATSNDSTPSRPSNPAPPLPPSSRPSVPQPPKPSFESPKPGDRLPGSSGSQEGSNINRSNLKDLGMFLSPGKKKK